MADNKESKPETVLNDESLAPEVETPAAQVPSQDMDLENVRNEVLPRMLLWIKKRVSEVKKATILDIKNSEANAHNGETSSNPSVRKSESVHSKTGDREEDKAAEVKNCEETQQLHEMEVENQEMNGEVNNEIEMEVEENLEMKTQNGEMKSNSWTELQETELESTPENVNGIKILKDLETLLFTEDDESHEQVLGDEMSELTNCIVVDSNSIEAVTLLETAAPSKMAHSEEDNNNGGESDQVQSIPMVDAEKVPEQQKEESTNPEQINGGERDEVQSTPIIDVESTQEQQKEEDYMSVNPQQEKEMNSSVEEENNGGGKDEVKSTPPMVDVAAHVTMEEDTEVIDVTPISYYIDPALKMKMKHGKLKLKQPATFLGEFPMIFEIPDEYVQYVADIDKVVTCHPDHPETNFMKRLEGWIIQHKRRAVGTIVDAYYLHKDVKKVFRSTKEVAEFIVYTIIREKPSSQSATKRKRLEPEPTHLVLEQRTEVEMTPPAGEQGVFSGENSDGEMQPSKTKEDDKLEEQPSTPK